MLSSSAIARGALLLTGALVSFAAGQGCYLSTSMTGIPAQRFAYALQNVTCPVNTGTLDLSQSGQISSILSTSKAIVATFEATTVYLKATDPITTSADTDLWRGPALAVPDQFSQYIGGLLSHKAAIIKNGNVSLGLSMGLKQQRDAAKVFFDLSIEKIDAAQKADLRGLFNPVLAEMECAIAAFKPASPLTACRAATLSGAASSTAASSRSMPTTHSRKTSLPPIKTSSITAPASLTTSTSASAKTTPSGAAMARDPSLEAVFVGFGLACGVWNVLDL